MKAITIKQPFAELILTGWKTIETRSWNTNVRGKIYVHTSKEPDRRAGEFHDIDVDSLLNGYLVGTVEIVKVIRYKDAEQFKSGYNEHRSPYQFYDGMHGWVLRNAQRIKPIPYKGSQGFFNVRL